MIYKTKYFELSELVCPHIYEKFGELAWQFIDSRLLETIDLIQEKIVRHILVNNYKSSGTLNERGFRCIQCDILKKAIKERVLTISPHLLGRAFDFDVKGMTAEEVRQWIVKNQTLLPYPVRLEAKVNWVHIDTVDNGRDKISFFDPK